ncbi:ABC transporter substrate-binding protein [Variovorax robiniae]|uniref:ABC transporter substrate-binding protein n=1 Tax=Variovorax robiniae TaxID=1836199 RepID=A0ABU8XA44_9BURK
MRFLSRFSICGAVVAAALSCLSAPAAADELKVVRIGGLRADSMIRLYHAQRAGYLAKEGLKPEFTMLGSGPAVASAVVSGSVDVGYSAIVPGIFARANNQPYKMFMTMATETGEAGHQGTWIAVKGASAVKEPKDLAGKTVAINASGALCELLVRDHLAKAGVRFDAVKVVVLPFPQMQAALETGNADAACLTEPFFAAAKIAPNVKARAVAAGMIADMDAKTRIAQDGMFVREDWGKANKEVLRKLVKAVTQATDDFKKDPAAYRNQMVAEFKLKPEVANQIAIYFDFGDIAAQPRDVQPLITAMQRNGMLKADAKAEDFVMSLD